MSTIPKELMQVTKRDGSKEALDYDKINKILSWATEGVKEVSITDIIIKAELSITNNIKTKDIHKVLIQAAVNCMSLETPNYQYVASRLLNFQIRKEVWGGVEAPKLKEIILSNISKKVYDKDILNQYSEEEVEQLDSYINHQRDFIFSYAGLKQMCDKYLIQDRTKKILFETPQFAYMIIPMVIFNRYPKEVRLDWIKRAYDQFSLHKLNLPTPQLAGIRTPLRAYSSCCLIEMGDTMGSILSTNFAIGAATSQRYGIGVNISGVRAIGSKVKGGEVVHTGLIPILKIVEANTKAFQQNGIRGGGATVTFPYWHHEVLDVLSLKNNGGTEENRVRKLDYSIAVDRLLLERFRENKLITLFSPHQVPDLYEAFGTPKFQELYEKYEKDPSVIKKTVSALELMGALVKERTETGRIYVFFIDLYNHHCSWGETVQMLNLCQEVGTPTVPLQSTDDPDAEIGICTLGAINWLAVDSEQDIKESCELAVRFLDELLDHQEYFLPAAENFALKRRSLAVGINNFAAWTAKKGFREWGSPDHLKAVDTKMELQQYYLLQASLQLAKEKGPCTKFSNTKYAKGILPIDTYKKDLDSICELQLSKDWDSLRSEIVSHGLRHSTLSGQMPVESCLSLDTKIQTPSGLQTFRKLLEDSGLNSDRVIDEDLQGWHELDLPLDLCTRFGNKQSPRVYYNGISSTTLIEMEDGTQIKATGEHKFLVRTESGDESWKKVYELSEEDDIITSEFYFQE